jgi:hypothetical protein
MTNKAFPTIPGTINIPDKVEDFKKEQQVVWTGSSWSRTTGITITDGPAKGDYWGSNDSFSIIHQKSMYNYDRNSGFRVFTHANTEKITVFYMNGNSRWMPASVFNGLGFETYHTHNALSRDHMVYLADYAMCFRHRTGSGKRYYGWGTGYTGGPGHDGYRFDRIQTSDYHVKDIRDFGSDWLYQGMVVALRTKGSGTGTTQSYITIYNMKVGSKFSTLGGEYRYLPLKNRSEANRDGKIGNKGFTDPFQL